MIGSARFSDESISGQVNGTLAKRSPGSALKPFIYALAIDQGLIHPLTMLKDAPTSFGAYSPENFDGRFVGPISATDALVRSRNVPAVALSARLAQPNFYQFLRDAGIAHMASEHHYGLVTRLGRWRSHDGGNRSPVRHAGQRRDPASSAPPYDGSRERRHTTPLGAGGLSNHLDAPGKSPAG